MSQYKTVQINDTVFKEKWYKHLEGQKIEVWAHKIESGGIFYWKPKNSDGTKFIQVSDTTNIVTSVKDPHESATKPAHYHTGKIDVIKFSEENFTYEELKGFYRMNVLKYVTRYDKKNGYVDLKKAEFYLVKLLDLEVERQNEDQ